MNLELTFSSIRQGDLPAADAWKLLTPIVETNDVRLAARICDVLRAWTWKALDRRRRDAGLREWVDLLNRVEAFLSDRFASLAARIEVLAELLHESLAVAELSSPEALLRRKHVAPILRALASCDEGWVDRGALMGELHLKPANTTRLMALLVDMGWVEQAINGREAAYRLSAEGMAKARTLPSASHAVRLPLLETKEWAADAAFHASFFGGSETPRHLVFLSYEHRHHDFRHLGGPWSDTAMDAIGSMDVHDDELLEHTFEETVIPLPTPRLALAGGMR